MYNAPHQNGYAPEGVCACVCEGASESTPVEAVNNQAKPRMIFVCFSNLFMFNMLSLWIVNGAIVGSKSEDEHLSISSRLEEEVGETERVETLSVHSIRALLVVPSSLARGYDLAIFTARNDDACTYAVCGASVAVVVKREGVECDFMLQGMQPERTGAPL